MNRSDSAPRKSWFKDGYINGRCNTDNQKTNGSISTPTTREFQALSKAGGIKANNQCPKKVMRRNPIAGKYDPQDIPGAYRSRRALIRPPGFYLRPHDCHSSQGEKRALVTENRAQYTNCKPWISRDIYSSAVQAREDNKLHCKSVHPSVNHYIYEDKYAVVRWTTHRTSTVHCVQLPTVWGWIINAGLIIESKLSVLQVYLLDLAHRFIIQLNSHTHMLKLYNNLSQQQVIYSGGKLMQTNFHETLLDATCPSSMQIIMSSDLSC